MSEFKKGDVVVFRNQVLHYKDPQHYPPPGTKGEVLMISIFLLVQWPTASTSYDDRWYCDFEDVVKEVDGVENVCPTCGRTLMERVTNSERSYPRLYNMSGYCWCGQKIDLEGNEAVPLGQTVVPWVRAKDRLPIEEWKQRQDIDGDALPVLVCRVEKRFMFPSQSLHRYIQTAYFDGEHFRNKYKDIIDFGVEYWGPFPEYPAGVSAYEELKPPEPPPMAGSDE